MSSKFDEMMGRIKNYNGGGYLVFDKSNRVNETTTSSNQDQKFTKSYNNGVPTSAVAGTHFTDNSEFSSTYKVSRESEAIKS